MRSRYSAFVVGDAGYLWRTWHPDTRPSVIDLDDATTWTGLEIVDTTGGTGLHSSGTVTFRANSVAAGKPRILREKSRFVRLAKEWVYVTGNIED